MSPPADQDPHLLFLQGKVAALRREHEDLVERERTLRASKHTASADAMRARVGRVFSEFQHASRELAGYIRHKQGGQ